MTRYVLLAVAYTVVIVSCPSILFSQRGAAGNRQFKLIKSEAFTKPVNSWFFPDVSENQTPQIIAVEKRQITWVNGHKSRSFNLPENILKVVFSKGGNYFGAISLSPESTKPNSPRTLQIAIYTSRGELLYTLQMPQNFDDPYPSVTISAADGSVIIGKNAVGKVLFYDYRGELVTEVTLFSDTNYDLERSLQIDISQSGSQIAIAAGKRGASPSGSNALIPSAEPHLFLFSPTGEELWRKALPGFNTTAIGISGDGRYVAVSSYKIGVDGSGDKNTLIFDGNGREIGRVPLLFKYHCFSPDGGFLIVAENNAAYAMELPRGNVAWFYQIPRKQGMITTAQISNNGETAVLLAAKSIFKNGAFIFSDPRLKILSRSGNLYQNLEIKNRVFEKPALRLSDDGHKMIIGFKDGYQVLECIDCVDAEIN